MNRSTRRCGWVLLLGLLLSSVAAAQPQPDLDRILLRHEPKRPQRFDDIPDGDPFALITERLSGVKQKGKSLEELQDLYQRILKDPGLVNRDPAVRKRLEELIKNSGMTLDPNDPRVKRLQEWLKNRPSGSKSPPLSPEAQEDLKRLLESFKNNKTETPPVEIPEVPPEPALEPVTPPEPIGDAELNSRREFTEWLLKQSRRLDDGRFQNSDLARQLRNDLARFASSGAFRDGKRWAADNKLGQRFSELTRDMRSMRLDVKLPTPNINLPRGSMPKLPALGGWGRPPSITGLPGIGKPGLPLASAPSGDVLVWLLALAVVGVAAWRLYKLYRPSGRGKGGISLRDLPWPTAPGAVATRADLVRAFEYLSLALLGRESRMWNHLAVAAKLGGEAPERRAAADTLASLYEQARYAPGDEPLPADAFAAAKRSLTLLRGGEAS